MNCYILYFRDGSVVTLWSDATMREMNSAVFGNHELSHRVVTIVRRLKSFEPVTLLPQSPDKKGGSKHA